MTLPRVDVKMQPRHNGGLKEDFRIQAIAHNVAEDCVIDKNTYAEISEVSGCFPSDGKWIVYDTDERAQVCEEKTFSSELSAYQDLAERLSFRFEVSDVEEGEKPTQKFSIGDVVRVKVTSAEGKRERVKSFEGIVVAHRIRDSHPTFTIRRTNFGVGMVRTFSIDSPRIVSVDVIRRGRLHHNGHYLPLRHGRKDTKTKK